MKLPTSNKSAASFGRKPHVKKGYYPAQLTGVKPYASKEKVLVEGKYGHQLIFEFAIYNADEKGKPTEQMTWVPDAEEPEELKPVTIPNFIYHEYKTKNPKPGEPLFQTAITPNSAITLLLKNLGWGGPTSSEEDVDPEQYIGSWVEVNVDDYEAKEGDEKYKASTIKAVNHYEGPEIKNVPAPASTENKKVEKQVKHEAVEKKAEPETGEAGKFQDQIDKLKELHKDGFLTDDGLKQAVEQLETKIEELKKK